MTKAELIDRYGIEWYEAHKAKSNNGHKEHYHKNSEWREARKAMHRELNKERYRNDPEYRERQNVLSREYNRESYCRPGELELIENYEIAKADNFKGWDIHHRLELTINGEYAHSTEELKRMNMYYNRPYFELIFLTRSEHNKLHNRLNGSKHES